MTDVRTETPENRPVDRAQYGLAAFLAVVGAYVVFDASTLEPGFSDDYLGPKALPYVIGTALVVLAVLLTIATSRGNVPEAEGGEDVELDSGTDWLTVAKLVGVFLVNIVLIDFLGWAITGAILFAGCAAVLGSRTYIRDVIVGAVMSV
ncbi:MAG: tripartite tricarboxylate transporter TctB family protein, partial [Actinomycetia bacterium]|nr:tripartite tricarboxylate transporter TctB family protein [Actinomycetes bacterium]